MQSDPIARLRAGLTYTGATLYGSCFQQAAANVLEALGVDEAAARIGLSWGFSWEAGRRQLGGGERWMSTFATLSGLDVRRLSLGTWEAAATAERAALERGAPVVVAVDSFHIESPYTGRRHLQHALIVVAWGDDAVTVLDPMNAPAPQDLPIEAYRRTRGEECVRDFEMIVFGGRVRESALSLPAAVVALADDAADHRSADLANLRAFVAAVEAGDVEADVADVAAERRCVQRLVASAAERLPRLRPVAEELDALTRRWYFAHTLATESVTPSSSRIARILEDLGAQDARVRDALTAAAGEPACEIAAGLRQ